ncbi:mevalonate kinase family protein [Lactococcus termiticola]|uniref:phosphomevalonate kinase n=1 Tax=Lactococcus termiticola TaxID=2169526 RepID=A0A2R5HJ23_9LACT|nr:phosphomevalonate kinase [Lactococcus termiticola]GBG96468.1 phosphomevalonate kinase [Lactococcus termiticola]
MIELTIPGKLFVAGEYAVTRSNGKAICVAVETGLKVRISERQGHSRLRTNVPLADHDFLINAFEIEAGGWAFALTALQKTLKASGRQGFPELGIEIDSPLGYGEDKTGYGSSAAVVVAVVQAVNSFLGLGLDQKACFEIAGRAHREVQGSGSMGDVASILTGGLMAYQSPDADFQNWKIDSLLLPAWETYIVKTGKSVKTGDKLKIALPEGFFERSDQLVEELARAIQTADFEAFKLALIENQALLIDSLPEAYLTDKLSLALETLNKETDLVAKVSGSGFGENLILFSKNGRDLTKLAEKLAEQGIILEKIKIASKTNEGQ